MRVISLIIVLMFLSANPAEARGQRCGKTVEAAGTRHATTYWARSSAKEAWKRLVLAKYGERYSDWRMAYAKTVHCDQASPLTERCVAIARPCRF